VKISLSITQQRTGTLCWHASALWVSWGRGIVKIHFRLNPKWRSR